ncbi:hypothetical protein ACFL6S_01345 [Candidatus Poribacteria bacterium]
MSILCFSSGGELLDESPRTISAFAGVRFQSRELEGESQSETVQQWTLPLFLAGRIGENLQFRIYQTAFDAKLEDGPNLRGLENTKIQGSYVLLRNTLVTYLGLSVPVDSIEPIPETVHLSNILYREVLDFSVNRVTAGLDLDMGFAFAQPVGRLSLGFGMGYLMRGSYDRLSQEGTLIDYNPGDPLSISVGLNSFSRMSSWGGRIIYIHYGDDEIDTEDSFENSDAISLRISAKARPGPITIRLFLGDTLKIEDDSLGEGVVISNFFRNRLSGGLALAYPLLAETIILNGQVGGKAFLDDDGINAKMLSFGGGFRILLTDNLKFDFSARLINGDMDDGRKDVSGYDLGAAVGYGF